MSSDRERFWANVGERVDGECWPWRGSLMPKGYGRFRRPWFTAHRASYEFNVGPIPVGLHVLHRCDNPPCVNPAHLWVGTNADNVRDMVAKGRQSRTAILHAIRAVAEQRRASRHCRRGHPYDDPPLVIGGRRICRVCRRETQRSWLLRRKALST